MTKCGHRVAVEVSTWPAPLHVLWSCDNIWVERWRGIHSCVPCLRQVDVLQLEGFLWSWTNGCWFHQVNPVLIIDFNLVSSSPSDVMSPLLWIWRFSLQPVQILLAELLIGEKLGATTHGLTRNNEHWVYFSEEKKITCAIIVKSFISISFNAKTTIIHFTQKMFICSHYLMH